MGSEWARNDAAGGGAGWDAFATFGGWIVLALVALLIWWAWTRYQDWSFDRKRAESEARRRDFERRMRETPPRQRCATPALQAEERRRRQAQPHQSAG